MRMCFRIMVLAVLLTAGCGRRQDMADRVFLNGLVWTGDAAAPWAEALAVRGDRLISVGSGDALRPLIGGGTEVIDLKGRFVCPGFNDAHLHFLALERVELDSALNVEEIQSRVLEYASGRDSGWIAGRGWTYTMFPGRNPNKVFLDEVISDRPVFLKDRDGHAALANSRALELAGINRATQDPEDGQIDRDSAGDPSGLLKEGAMDLVFRIIPPPDDEELYETLRMRLAQAASYGLTSVQNASTIRLAIWERVQAEGALKVRVYASLPFVADPDPKTLAGYGEMRDRYTGPWIKFGAVKGMLDGTVDSKTAAMFEPYAGGGTGIPMWNQDDLDRAVALYDRENFQILLHAIGDRAVRMALDAYEAAARSNGTRGRRHRIEHVEVPALDDLPRFRDLGVIASTQAIFARPDEATLGNYAVLLGPERAARSNAFRLFDEVGAVQAFGSDWPVFPMQPLQGIYAAVSRSTPEGNPRGGWYPENSITAEAALRHYTFDAAFASFDEEDKGTLTAGRLADFVVLSENILEGSPDRILEARVLQTVAGGCDTFADHGSLATVGVRIGMIEGN